MYLCNKVYKIKPYYLLLLLTMLLVSVGCLKSNKPGIPEPVRRVINQAELHKVAFLNAMVSYDNPEDSLKLKALYYLIANMGSHYEITYKISDSTGKRYTIPIADYPDYQTLKKHLRLLKEKDSSLKVMHDTILLDIKTVSSQLLTTNTDTAFKSWANPLYNQNIYSFNDFCQYILPYRVANEKAEPFRHFFRSRYSDKIFNLLHPSQVNPVSLTSRIHQLVVNDVHFDKRYEIHYNYPDLNEIASAHKGNYRDIALYEVKAFRSFGIASTMDYTPYFADSSGGYFWPAVMVSGQHFIPVLYPGFSTDYLTKPGKISKVYRRIYSDDTTSLFRIKKMSEHTPAFLGQFNYDDVTDEYVPTANINVTLTDTARYAYLAVFNGGSWHPVQWSNSQNQLQTHFSKMGVDILYLPMIVRNERTLPAGQPFLLEKDGTVKVLDGQTNKPAKKHILSLISPHQFLQPNQTYFLYQWNNSQWQKIKSAHSGNKGTLNTSLKPYTLYLISQENSAKWFDDERPFIVKNSTIHFY